MAAASKEATVDEDHLSMSLAARRTRRPHILPPRFRDDIPQPLVQVPPPLVDLSNLPVEARPSCEQAAADTTARPPSTRDSAELPVASRSLSVVQCFRTPRNAFRLLRQYFSPTPPSHDPEELVNFSDLCEGCGEIDGQRHSPEDPHNNEIVEPHDVTTSVSLPESSFGPYPNESSFLLGEWYWTNGRQKSKDDFRSLLNIVGRPEFQPVDVRDTNWRAIDAKLGTNEFDEEPITVSDDENEELEWLDDAGWRRSAITVSVPFHSRSKNPGAKDFSAGYLYHRSLVAVIKETLSDPDQSRHFHYEPFALLWEKYLDGKQVHVHGELYTSPTFQQVHHNLQAAPNEPNCDLQKVVVALMFLSDATHLTQFGTAKLWPGYLMFGNHSKYRRCKPSCNLCHHIAYFQGVSVI